jgi:transposase-like protein
MVPRILEEVEAYTDAVARGKVHCDLAACPRCGEKRASFRLYDCRGRTFLVVVERLVKKIRSQLTRWKCRLCNKSFTLYSSFALPYKRYVRDQIFECSEAYLEDETSSYRRGVEVHGLAIFHDGSTGEKTQEQTLHGSTLHRWIGALGNLRKTLLTALHLIRVKDPSSLIFRTIASLVVAPRRYRSEERKALLRSCQELLVTEEEYRSIFDVSIFPHLATACDFS